MECVSCASREREKTGKNGPKRLSAGAALPSTATGIQPFTAYSLQVLLQTRLLVYSDRARAAKASIPN